MTNLINLSHADAGPEDTLEGYDAYDHEGHRLGKVDSVIADGETMEIHYLVVDTGGWFTHRQFVVPVGDIEWIDDQQLRVTFSTLTKRTLESGAYPRYDATWWDRNDFAGFAAHERDIARAYEANRAPDTDVDRSAGLYRRRAEGTERLQLLEERLRTQKERYQAGVVRVGKRILERTETLDVPVREEQVIIERRVASGQLVQGDTELREEVIADVRIMRERVVVSKEPVVVEEVLVRKEAVEHTEHIEETLRREELVVEDPAGLVAGAPGGSPTEDRPALAGALPDGGVGTAAPVDEPIGGRPRPDASQGTTDDSDGEPLSEEQEAAGTAVVGERPFEYTFGAMDEPSEDALVIGVPVVTADGEPIGTVGAVERDRVRISAPLAADYWLPRDAFTGTAPGGDLVLRLTRDELEGYRG